MPFKILSIFTQDGQLVVRAEHYNANGTFWFEDNYTWQGREGLLRKRATNALGQLLQDDDSVAPTRLLRRGPPDEVEQFLEPGRTWKLRPGPHLDEASILSTIQSTHQRRLGTGWPQTKVDRLGRFKQSQKDTDGVAALLAHFQGLQGRVV